VASPLNIVSSLSSAPVHDTRPGAIQGPFWRKKCPADGTNSRRRRSSVKARKTESAVPKIFITGMATQVASRNLPEPAAVQGSETSSFNAPCWLAAERSSTRKVYTTLLGRRTDPEQTSVVIAVPELARMAGLGVRTVQEALTLLEKSRRIRRRSHGNRPNEIVLLAVVPAPPDTVAETREHQTRTGAPAPDVAPRKSLAELVADVHRPNAAVISRLLALTAGDVEGLCTAIASMARKRVLPPDGRDGYFVAIVLTNIRSVAVPDDVVAR
jgi:hypothetical protein